MNFRDVLMVAAQGGESSFDPLSLFGASQKGVLWDASDSATAFQLNNGTTAAAAGDPVGYLGDKSGNTKHAIQAVAGQKMVRRTAAGLWYLETDTTDDWIGAVTPAFTSTMDILVGCQKTSAGSAPISRIYNDLTTFLAVNISGSGTAANANSGSPSYKINGVAVPGGMAATRAQLYTAWTADTPVVLEIIGADLSGWTGFGIGDYPSIAGLSRVYTVIARETLSAAELAAARTWTGSKCGLSL